MDIRVNWSPEAIEDIESIAGYIETLQHKQKIESGYYNNASEVK